MESGGACSAPTKELACDIAPYQIQTFWDRSYYFFFQPQLLRYVNQSV